MTPEEIKQDAYKLTCRLEACQHRINELKLTISKLQDQLTGIHEEATALQAQLQN